VRILFWGTPAFAVPSLRALDDEGFDIVGVVTQPDRPAGRGRRVRPSEVKEVALEQGFPVFTPDRPRTEEFMAAIRALEPDVSVVVAYGHILLPEVLNIPRLGSINVHASLLPELRGAAPINWAIARGFTETGVTIMRMAAGMDSGPILHQVREPIFADETAGDLTLRLSEVGAAALIEALALLGAGLIEEVEQDHDAATFAPKLDREVARIDWTGTSAEVSAFVRGMDPAPGAWTILGEDPIKLFRPTTWSSEEGEDSGGPTPPGLIARASVADGVVVATAEGAVAFAEVQPPGKRRMDARDWVNGRGVEAGQRFT
jgi:methionyl-tRNA formyltransferase